MHKKFEKITIVHNTKHQQAENIVKKLMQSFTAHGASVSIEQMDPDNHFCYRTADLPSDLCVVVGGDGTFLSAARCFAPRSIPLLGINCGNLGFLSQSSIQEIDENIDKLFDGNYEIEERSMLQAVDDLETPTFIFTALNDMVIKRGPDSGTLLLCVYVDRHKLNDFYGDGLIVSSPTGSTAYNLSVGGPIVAPDINAMIVSPISSHSLAIRPIVINESSTVKIVVSNEQKHVYLTADGQDHVILKKGSVVFVRKLDYSVKLVLTSKQGNNFYNILRTKLHWGIFPGTCPPLLKNIGDTTCFNCRESQ